MHFAKAKLAKLIEIEGYDSIEELMEAVFSDSVSGCDRLARYSFVSVSLYRGQLSHFVRFWPSPSKL
jgi:hypothetical protein